MQTAVASNLTSRVKLSVVIPCFNEEQTLEKCVDRVLTLLQPDLSLEIIIVDDCSKDRSLSIAQSLESRHPNVIRLLRHQQNKGKGAALRTGFREASGDFVAIQDADLEYEPQELGKLLEPLRDGRADVVIGSRFKGAGPHRVLYFWHSVGNVFLTLLSNMFSDLNLTDMETCYKVFRRDVLRGIEIEEERFGFEPEIVAKVAHRNLRIYEAAISYQGRTYEEGKKITWKDGVRALYCIFRYNSAYLPFPVQLLAYLCIGCAAATMNLFSFVLLSALHVSLTVATGCSFVLAAAVNYFLCIAFLFRHKARWSSALEILIYIALVGVLGVLDLATTRMFYTMGVVPWVAKSLASFLGLLFNFLGRRFLIFPRVVDQNSYVAEA